jgi:N-acyl-D-amino-acid deacylase
MFDLIIRNGTVVDGSAGPRFVADVAIKDGIIAAVGHDLGPAAREIDASGLLVAPGWVDAHTHYDGQIMWDRMLTPSCWHGVTTAVLGNCGVGFAPVRPEGRALLIDIMEGVEDIPRATLEQGLAFDWETFPEYMDAIEAEPLVMDVAVQIPHSAVRLYVMGERGRHSDEATSEEIGEMTRIMQEALDAGAVGISSSRTAMHRGADGEVVPGSFVDKSELLAFRNAIKQAGHGVFELASDITSKVREGSSLDEEFEWMTLFSKDSGAPISFPLVQMGDNPNGWRDIMARIEKADGEGANLVAQFSPRAVGMVIGWDTSFHPFMGRPTYDEIADLPMAQRITRLKDPAIRGKILAEHSDRTAFPGVPNRFDSMYRLADDTGYLDYEPTADLSVQAKADQTGVPADQMVYDMLMENDGDSYIYVPLLNYAANNLDVCLDALKHPNAMVSLSDAGAHCGAICDASTPTFMLTFWTRDRRRGSRISVEEAVWMQSRRTAEVYGLEDRGLIAPGKKADINVIDYDNLQITAPSLVADLPAGGMRLLQGAEGYRYTIMNGAVTFEDGKPTGAMPGAVVRMGQKALVAA